MAIRWVEIDPERAPLITWAFEQYATGDWSISQLREALTDKGFATRPTRRHPGRKISVNGLHKMLTNPYYAGIVPYQGAYHEGTHDALVDMATWLRVQDVLRAHNSVGEKDRVHAHYLKGSIFCGACGSRLVFSRKKGRGGTYDYFFCMGRKFKRQPCTRKAVQVQAVEAGVAAFYETFQVSPADVATIQATIHEELATERKHAAFTATQAKKRLDDARRQREKLLQAHYAGAVPLDMLKNEMNRFMREMASAEQELTAARSSVADLEGQLERALTVAGDCARRYATATPPVRRLMNQGFFEKLYVGPDGGIERADFTEPFRQFLGPGAGVSSQAADGTVTVQASSDVQPSTNQVELKVVVTCRVGSPEHEDTHRRQRSAVGVKLIVVAEREGFEPSVRLPAQRFSRPSNSTTLAPLQ